MHARFARYTFSGNAQEIARKAEEGALPIFKSLPGFKAYSIAESDGEIFSFSVWETFEQAEAAEHRGRGLGRGEPRRRHPADRVALRRASRRDSARRQHHDGSAHLGRKALGPGAVAWPHVLRKIARCPIRTCPPPIATTRMPYRRCGRSGLQLPAISLGLWQNFGARPAARDEPRDRAPRVRPRRHALRPRQQLRAAVRLGRGELRPAPARRTSRPYRDELVISTKAGYDMWPGPYGDCGSRKYLLASLDQSLARMGLDYVDIFYSHRFDPETPLEETMGALDTAVRQGKALYVGISSYSAEKTARGGGDPARPRHAAPDPPAVVLDAQPLDRGRACSTRSASSASAASRFSPLAQGMLTDRYLDGIPEGSRASRDELALARPARPTRRSSKIRALNEIAAAARPDARADGARLDAARPARDLDARSARAASSSSRTNLGALDSLDFTDDELAEIDRYATDSGINLWEQPSS